MTKNKNLKKRVRARMQKTGESYTTARARLVEKKTSVPHDAAERAGISDKAVVKKTGLDWAAWTRTLDGLGAAQLSHRDIAQLVRARWPDIGGWWAQSVTVGYERIRGLRAHGQKRTDGSFEANKSRTFAVPVSRLYREFSQKRLRERWMGPDATVRTSSVDKSIRFQWPNGTRVVAYFTAKGTQKSSVAVQHQKLASEAAREKAKSAWGERLDRLAARLRGA